MKLNDDELLAEVINSLGGFTPQCNECGVRLCWDISLYEYLEDRGFWDTWKCRGCNPNYKGALKRYREEKSLEKRC